jgi:SAM-dependent methyltransferase
MRNAEWTTDDGQLEGSNVDDYIKANLELWNNWALIHEKAEAYDLEGFRAGKLSLNTIELEEIGDVAGKSLLHLQCHFGKDTLSWARLGASVTGADFSDKAIALARSLSEELGIPADFVCSNVYDLPDVLPGQFDIVFTSYGVLYWLPDIDRWAQVVGHFLKPGGTFYIVEFHPFAWVFEDAEEGEGLKVSYPYFTPPEPLEFETHGTYADPDADYHSVEYGWNHSLGEIVSALISAGLTIEFLHEFPFSIEGSMFKALERGEDDRWRLKDPRERAGIPLMFSIRAARR